MSNVKNITRTINNKPVRFEFSQDMPEIFADGVYESAIGVPFSKIVFTSSHPPTSCENGEDVRSGVATIVIPSNTLVEFCINVLRSLPANQEAMETALAGFSSNMIQMVQSLKVDTKEEKKKPAK